MPSRDEIAMALSTLSDRTVQSKGNSLWITCPWHGNGQEKTPSLKVNLEGQGNYPPGTWVCFGCSPQRHGGWHKLAVKLGLRHKDDDEDSPYAAELGKDLRSKLLSEEDDTNPLHDKLAREPIIQASQNWRGIKGWLLHTLKARVTQLNSAAETTEYSRVYLPVEVKGKWCGGIFCSWSKNSKLKYENEKHASNEILFPYDYVVEYLKDVPPSERQVCIVEGPRDALNLIQNDVMALANLGGDTVWSEDKSELIVDLNLSCLVVATDPDEVGNSLANLVKRSLGKAIPKIMRFKMKVTRSPSGKVLEKEDPGNLSFDRMQYLKNMMKEL